MSGIIDVLPTDGVKKAHTVAIEKALDKTHIRIEEGYLLVDELNKLIDESKEKKIKMAQNVGRQIRKSKDIRNLTNDISNIFGNFSFETTDEFKSYQYYEIIIRKQQTIGYSIITPSMSSMTTSNIINEIKLNFDTTSGPDNIISFTRTPNEIDKINGVPEFEMEHGYEYILLVSNDEFEIIKAEEYIPLFNKEIKLDFTEINDIFNNDGRVYQLLLILTDGFYNFENIFTLYINSPYTDIKRLFITDTTISISIKSIDEKPNLELNKFWEQFLAYYNNNIISNPSRYINYKSIKSIIEEIIEYIKSKNINISELSSDLTLDPTKKSFDFVDAYIKKKLKNAWMEYMLNMSQFKSELGKIKSIDLKFDDLTDAIKALKTKYFVLGNDEHYLFDASGNIQTKTNQSSCPNFGLDGSGDCDIILQECLINGDNTKLTQCVDKLNEKLRTMSFDENKILTFDSYDNINPELALALLHRFGFKAYKNPKNNNRKNIFSVSYWEKNIKPKLFPELILSDNIKKYFIKLITYVNLNEEILNNSKLIYKYDSKKDKNYYGIEVDIPSKNISKFYEDRKNTIKNIAVLDYIIELYIRYGIEPPVELTVLQSGGAEPNNNCEELLNLYKILKKNLTKINFDEEFEKSMNNLCIDAAITDMEAKQYRDFFEKVNLYYKLFDLINSSVSFSSKNIKDMSFELEEKINKLKKIQETISNILTEIAKKEIIPDASKEDSGIFSVVE
jgi:hypothetical protein